jgi:hypothetical protein
MGEWTIEPGTSEIIKHRIIVYTGDLKELDQIAWQVI